MCGGGGGKSQTVYQQQMPTELTDQLALVSRGAYDLADDPFVAYSGQRVAGLNNQQTQAMGQAGALARYQAPRVQAQTGKTTNATAATGEATNMEAAQINAPGGWSIEGKDLSGYTNPWEKEVVRTSMSDIDAELARAQSAAAGNAAMAGAWGGSSAGIEQAALAGDAMRTRASTIAGLRSAGYGRAQDLASADISRGLTLAQSQAALDQEAASTNAGAANTFGLANMSAQNQFGLANKAATDQFTLANMQARETAGLANQQASLSAAGIRNAGIQQQWGMGSAQQATEQAQYDVDYDEFLRRINDQYQKTQFAAGILTGAAPNFATSSTTSRTPSPNPWATGAGVAAIGAGLASFAKGGVVGGLSDGLPGYLGGGTLPSRGAVPMAANDDAPEDPELARLLEDLAAQDVEAGIDPNAAAPAQARPQPAVRPPMRDGEDMPGGMVPPRAPAGRPAGPQAGVPGGDVRVSLAMPDQDRPDAVAAREAGLPVDVAGAPRVAGLAPIPQQPLVMPGPAAYSAPPADGRMYGSTDPVIQARYSLESGGNPAAMNERTGAVGLGQFRPDRLVDLGVYQPSPGETWSANGRATRAPWTGRFSIPGFPDVQTVQDLQASPGAQEEIERRNIAYERQQIQGLGLDRYVGRTIAGLEITDQDLRNAIQIAGARGAARFFESGGQYNPSDGNMRVSEYLARARAGGGRGAGAAPRAPAGGVPADATVNASGPVQGGVPETPVGGAAEGGVGIAADSGAEAGRPGWLERVRRGLRDPASEEAAGPMALIAAGLGMLQSRSPHLATAIGEGGMMGVQSLAHARQQRGQDRAIEASTRYRDRMAAAAEARARQAGAASRDARLPVGYQWDPQNPGRQMPIPGGPQDPVNLRGPESRVLSPEEVAQLGFRPGTVVTQDTDPRTGRPGAPVVRQQPRERQIPQGWEENPDEPGRLRRIPGYQEERPLPPATINALSEVGTRIGTLDRLRSTFQDDYGGKGAEFVGTISNWVGRNVGAGFHDQAQWWQDYQGFVNEVRHTLFGSALTPGEAAQFNRWSVNPGMSAATIRENLGRQRAIAEQGAARQGAALIGSGYNPEPVATALGIPIEQLERARARRTREGDTIPAEASGQGASQRPGGAAGGAGGAGSPGGDSRPPSRARGQAAPAANDDNVPVVRSAAEAARLPPGSRFRGPDGRVRMVPERAAAGGR